MKLARILVFLPLAMLFLTPVHATTPVLATGTFKGLGNATIIESRTADGITFVTVTSSVEFSGGIQAQGTFAGSFITDATGFVTVTLDGSITGTVTESSTGSAQVHGTATGQFDPVSKTVTLQGQLTVGRGTLGLAGLHGGGTFAGHPGIGLSYSVQVHFDP